MNKKQKKIKRHKTNNYYEQMNNKQIRKLSR